MGPVPPWAPEWLSWAGRAPLEGPAERQARAAYAASAGFRSAELILRACVAQETYRARQRSLAHQLEAFRATRLVKEERDGPWGPQLVSFALDHLRGRPHLRGTTILSWVWCLVGIVPSQPSARELRQLRDIVGHTWPLRTLASGLPRKGGPATERAATAAREAGSYRLALALLLIARAGSRASDAVRVASGFIDGFELPSEHLVVFPSSEKSDQMGARVIEPLVLPWPSGTEDAWHEVARDCFGDHGPTSAEAAAALRRDLTRALRNAGVSDARGPRRELAERVAANHGRARAGQVLRHAKGAAVTARYATTRDAVPTLMDALRQGPG